MATNINNLVTVGIKPESSAEDLQEELYKIFNDYENQLAKPDVIDSLRVEIEQAIHAWHEKTLKPQFNIEVNVDKYGIAIIHFVPHTKEDEKKLINLLEHSGFDVRTVL